MKCSCVNCVRAILFFIIPLLDKCGCIHQCTIHQCRSLCGIVIDPLENKISIACIKVSISSFFSSFPGHLLGNTTETKIQTHCLKDP